MSLTNYSYGDLFGNTKPNNIGLGNVQPIQGPSAPPIKEQMGPGIGLMNLSAHPDTGNMYGINTTPISPSPLTTGTFNFDQPNYENSSVNQAPSLQLPTSGRQNNMMLQSPTDQQVGQDISKLTQKSEQNSNIGEGISSGLKSAANIASNTMSQLDAASSSYAVEDYKVDLQNWQAQGKDWFNPDSDVAPTLQQYLEGMPSSTDALTKSTTMGGGSVGNSAGARAEQIFLNPAGVFGKMGGYVGEKAVQGAIEGAGGGGWGSVAGGVIGAIEGIFSWNKAQADDNRKIEQARKDFELQYKNWQIAKQKLQQSNRYNAQISGNEQDAAQKRATEQKQMSAANTRRQRLQGFLLL